MFVGWEHVDKPLCCGQPVETRAFIGGCYQAKCDICNTFIYDVTAPQFGNGSVRCFNSDAFPEDTDWERRWVCGKPVKRLAGAPDQ